METSTALVYRLTSPSGKVYIGKTSKTLEKRLCSHANDRARLLRLGKPIGRFYSAWDKYPINTWTREVLTIVPKDTVDVVEREQIHLHRSTDPQFGYNMAKGGEGGDTGKNGDPVKRKNHSDYLKQLNLDPAFTRARVAKAQETISRNPERFQHNARLRASKLRRGSNHQNHTGMWVVYHIPYGTLAEAIAATNISESTIMKYCMEPDRPHKSTKYPAVRGMTPREQGFYRITNKEKDNGKV